jgi:dUTP pyrophosphatase
MVGPGLDSLRAGAVSQDPRSPGDGVKTPAPPWAPPQTCRSLAIPRPLNLHPPAPAMALTVRFQRLPSNPDLPLPSRATEGASGYDLRSAEDDFDLLPGVPRAVATGLRMELPHGVEGQVRPRSGLALRHAVTVPNAPGTIDPDYRGELRVPLLNLGVDLVRIRRGDRVAQIVFARFESPGVEEVDELSESRRGEGGFGSTGTE